MTHALGRGLCPQCGKAVWVGPSPETYGWVRSQIRAEGGIGRLHRCEIATVAAAIEVEATRIATVAAAIEVEATRQVYVRPRPIELGPVSEEIDWLTTLGRTLPVEQER